MQEPDYFYIIDGHSLIHRFYHTPMRPLSGPQGSCTVCKGKPNFGSPDGTFEVWCGACRGTGREPTQATYLFVKMLVELVRRRKPDYLAVCYDGPRHLLRRKQISETYKEGRSGTKEDLTVQIKRIKQIVQLLGVAGFEIPGYEADDLIATLVKKCVSDDVHVRIVSRDKDMGCLLSDRRVLMYDPTDDIDIGPEWIRSRFKVRPGQMLDYLSLVGDGVDGIAGVKGIGEKTAARWLQEYGSVHRLLSRCTETSAAFKKLQHAFEVGELKLARDLVRLDRDAPMQFKARTLECDGLDLRSAAPVFKTLGFRKWENE